MGAPSICVVMSTYNGERYLREQLDSILAQDVENLSVLVRDDGSSDGTVEILRAYEREGKITLLAEPNVGVVRSFLAGIAAVPYDVDYVALSDQDDVWHPDKLSHALEVMQRHDHGLPQLYCAEYVYCDEQMNPGSRSHLNQIGVTFETMLFENMVSGNTCVFNRALADRIIDAGSEGVYCHDWWLALVATAIGELIYDKDFLCLDYRRTGSNVSPSGTGGLSLLRYRIKTFFEKGQLKNVTTQLERLREAFGDDMPAGRRALLDRVLDSNRVSKMVTPVRLRQQPKDEVAVRLLLLAGLL